ncbi:MAG: hypothetical protein JJU10_09330 [Idiomarina sp.]|nr:hypothetical protein [Idiomarina sp.]
MIKLSVSLLLCALLLGCSSPMVHEITGQVRPAISPSEVVVYRNIPPNYEEIAILIASSPKTATVGDESTTQALFNQLQIEAAALGANGVIVTELVDEPVDVRTTNYDGTSYNSRLETRFQRTAKA